MQANMVKQLAKLVTVRYVEDITLDDRLGACWRPDCHKSVQDTLEPSLFLLENTLWVLIPAHDQLLLGGIHDSAMLAADRELAFFKLAIAHGPQRSEVLELVTIFGGKVVDVGRQALTIALSGDPGKLFAFEATLRPFGLIELARTGRITLRTSDSTMSFNGMPPYDPRHSKEDDLHRAGGGALCH
jgi:Small subunit of acetolactate synthase